MFQIGIQVSLLAPIAKAENRDPLKKYTVLGIDGDKMDVSELGWRKRTDFYSVSSQRPGDKRPWRDAGHSGDPEYHRALAAHTDNNDTANQPSSFAEIFRKALAEKK